MPQKELERLQAVHRFLNLNIDKDQHLHGHFIQLMEVYETNRVIILILHLIYIIVITT